MRKLLSSLDSEVDPCTHPEFRKQAKNICARYVAGAWEIVPPEKLEITRIKGATSNVLFICSLPSEFKTNNGIPNKVLLRICFNPDKENSLVDTIVFALLSERQIGPKLFGIFDEGRIEEYIESRPLTTDELGVHDISSEIARLLARIHQLKIPILKQPEYLHQTFDRWTKQLVKTVGKHHHFKVLEEFQDLLPSELSCEDIAREVHHLRVSISVCVDLSPEIPNHFVEYTLCYDVDEYPYYKTMPEKFPDHDQMLRFMRNYLKELKPNASDAELETEAELLQYAQERLHGYFQNKHLLEQFNEDS